MKKIQTLLIVLLIFILAACSAGGVAPVSGGAVVDAVVTEAAATPETQVIAADATESGAEQAAAAVVVVPEAAGDATAAQALAENSQTHADPGDTVWDEAEVVAITLDGAAITTGGAGVTVDGSRATITAAGTYRLSGALADGQIVVNTGDEGVVRLILDGVDITSASSAPIYVANAEKTVIILAAGSENRVADAVSYVFDDPEAEEPNAAIFSKSDLTIAGDGALSVTGNFNDGIASKDGLVIAGGAITVSAVDDGVRGKDYLVVQAGSLNVSSHGDGLKADNEEDADKGYIAIDGGEITVSAAGDAITAASDVLITGGTFTLTTGGGAAARADEATSAKAIKGAASVIVDGGSFTIDAADDALHTNGSLVINGGTFQIAAADDGMHADATLEVNAGSIRVIRSYEGIESAVITLNGGSLDLTASDDGVNVAGGQDGSGTTGWGQPPADGQQPGGMGFGGGPGMDAFASSSDYFLYVNGGYIVVNAGGDGVDVNGAIEMTGGTLLVNGPTEAMNAALDYDGGFTLTGGFLAAAGSAGMAMAPGADSTQPSALIYFDAEQAAGSLVHIVDSAGQAVLTFAPAKACQSLVFSSPALVSGQTYTVYTGGSATGDSSDGLYSQANYTGGAQIASFTIASSVTTVGSGGMGRRP